MENNQTLQEYLAEMQKYIKKLLRVIDNDALLTLFGTKLVKKIKLDDILCCIEANFPKEYKEYLRKHGPVNLSSYKCYNNLIEMIRNKFVLDPSIYVVKYEDVERCAMSFLSLMISDIKKIYDGLI